MLFLELRLDPKTSNAELLIVNIVFSFSAKKPIGDSNHHKREAKT